MHLETPSLLSYCTETHTNLVIRAVMSNVLGCEGLQLAILWLLPRLHKLMVFCDWVCIDLVGVVSKWWLCAPVNGWAHQLSWGFIDRVIMWVDFIGFASIRLFHVLINWVSSNLVGRKWWLIRLWNKKIFSFMSHPNTYKCLFFWNIFNIKKENIFFKNIFNLKTFYNETNKA